VCFDRAAAQRAALSGKMRLVRERSVASNGSAARVQQLLS
jgi:hypothetical protein